jgi:hypothetical protein
MAKRLKDLLKQTKPTPWGPIPDVVKCDRQIDPTRPVRNRKGELVHLVSFNGEKRWGILARIAGHASGYVASYTLNGAYHNETVPDSQDLFNTSLRDYAKRFPTDKRVKL